MDVTARAETLKGAGGAAMVQAPFQPSYGVSLHKVQALTIKHVVRGCLEGVFAWGSIYVLTSRVNEPRNYQLIGLPPMDMLDEVAAKWLEHGLDVNLCFQAASV